MHSSGDYCVNIDSCVDDPCGAGGLCVDTPAPGTGYNCSCTTGYVLNNDLYECEEVDGCEGVDCGGGSCVDVAAPGTGYTCDCDDVFSYDASAGMCVEDCFGGSWTTGFIDADMSIGSLEYRLAYSGGSYSGSMNVSYNGKGELAMIRFEAGASCDGADFVPVLNPDDCSMQLFVAEGGNMCSYFNPVLPYISGDAVTYTCTSEFCNCDCMWPESQWEPSSTVSSQTSNDPFDLLSAAVDSVPSVVTAIVLAMSLVL